MIVTSASARWCGHTNQNRVSSDFIHRIQTWRKKTKSWTTPAAYRYIYIYTNIIHIQHIYICIWIPIHIHLYSKISIIDLDRYLLDITHDHIHIHISIEGHVSIRTSVGPIDPAVIARRGCSAAPSWLRQKIQAAAPERRMSQNRMEPSLPPVTTWVAHVEDLYVYIYIYIYIYI